MGEPMSAQDGILGHTRSHQRLMRDYRDHVSGIAQARLRTVCLVLLGLFVVDGGYEAIARTAAFWQDFWVRVGSAVVLVCVIAMTRAKRTSAAIATFAALVVLTVALDVESAILALGAAGSAFFVGLVLVVVAAGLLFPFGVEAPLGYSALVALVYFTPVALGRSSGQAGLVGDQAFLLFCGTVVAVAGNHVTGKLRKSEFFAREALRAEKDLSERLLLNILPRPIAERLKSGEHTIAERVGDASVLFADIVGFTPLSEKMSAEALVSVLDEVFSEFDRAASLHGLEKIKTIGDAYMVAAGLPTPREDHLEAIADMALEMRRAIARVNEHRGLSLAVRIGIHSGPVVAGVIGTTKFSYDVWGDTVNTASRMESHGAPGEIQVTNRVRERLQESYEFSEPRIVNVKGKGELETCFLISKRGEEGESREGRER